MTALLIGYARVSTDEQDLTAQQDSLAALGVSAERIYLDHGLTGTNRDRPGLREALAACRAGDTLVVTKLDRLARSLPDARAILDDLTRRRSSSASAGWYTTPPTLSAGCCSTCWPWSPSSKPTSSAYAPGKAWRWPRRKVGLRGKQPKLNARQEAHLVALHQAGEHSTAELADLFGVGRSTVYRAIDDRDAGRRASRKEHPMTIR
jgi:DNA invertase Pin-like site-specific DNA recombinase